MFRRTTASLALTALLALPSLASAQTSTEKPDLKFAEHVATEGCLKSLRTLMRFMAKAHAETTDAGAQKLYADRLHSLVEMKQALARFSLGTETLTPYQLRFVDLFAERAGTDESSKEAGICKKLIRDARESLLRGASTETQLRIYFEAGVEARRMLGYQ